MHSDELLPVLPPTCATNFHVAKSRSSVYFLQHENLLRAEVVLNTVNKQSQLAVARQVERKCCPYYLASKAKFSFFFFFCHCFVALPVKNAMQSLCVRLWEHSRFNISALNSIICSLIQNPLVLFRVAKNAMQMNLIYYLFWEKPWGRGCVLSGILTDENGKASYVCVKLGGSGCASVEPGDSGCASVELGDSGCASMDGWVCHFLST